MPILNKKIFLFSLSVFFLCISPAILFAASAGQPTSVYDATINQLYREQTASEQVSADGLEPTEPALGSDTYIRYLPVRHIDAAPGKVGVIESGNECTYEFKAFDKMPVELSFVTEYISINNSGGVKLPSHLTGLTAGIQATRPFFGIDNTYFRLGLFPSYNSENWNARSSSFRMPVHTYLIYKRDENLIFIAGVGTYPDYETKVVPIIGVIYKPNDKLTFNIIPDNPTISYVLNNKVTLFVEGGMQSGEYEVDKDGLKNVILQYVAYRGGAGISYKFNKYIESSVSVGSVFNRRMQYRDSLGKVNIDGGIYSEFRVSASI